MLYIWVIKITTINENILKSYLTDFRDKYVKEDTEKFNLFMEEFIRLCSLNDKLTQNINNLEKRNSDITSYIKDMKVTLSQLVIKNQKLLEQYNKLLKDNDRLNNIKHSVNSKNNKQISQINTYQNKTVEYTQKISRLENDIEYYKNIMENLSLITDTINDTSISIDENIQFADIRTSPHYRLIENSNQFDSKYYTKQYLDKYEENIDPIEHFLQIGAKQDYNPNEQFNTKWYRIIYLDDNYDINPFVEYLSYGIKHDRLIQPEYNKKTDVDITQSQEYLLIDESEYFDKDYYKNHYELDDDIDLVAYYLTCYDKAAKPCEDFNVEWYNRTYLQYLDANPLLDYITHPDTRYMDKTPNEYNMESAISTDESQLYNAIEQSQLLDKTWYHNNYKINDSDLINHFINEGFKKGYTLNKSTNNNQNQDIWQYLFDNTDNNISGYDSIPQAQIRDSQEYHILQEDELFDENYYLETYHDVKNAKVDALQHYLQSGYKEGRSPSEQFNNNQYIRNHPNCTINPLLDYLLHNKQEYIHKIDKDESIQTQDLQEYAILDNPLVFDREYYLKTNSDVKANQIDSLEHFIKYGQYEGRNPKANMNLTYLYEQIPQEKDKYLQYTLDVYKKCDSYKLEAPDEIENYERNYQLLKDSIYFNQDYYIKHNPSITEDDDAIDYYLRKGRYEKYPTSKIFSHHEYLKYNLDLKHHGVDPLVHFILSGLKEQRPYRRPKLEEKDFDKYPEGFYQRYSLIYDSNLFSEEYYVRNNPQIIEEDTDPIIDYLVNGVRYSRNPSSLFSTSRYLKYHGDIKRTGFNPLYHYLTNGIKEKRFIYLPNEYFLHNIQERYTYLQTHKMLNALKSKKTIILEYNPDTEYFKKTLSSILSNTNINYELMVISTQDIPDDIKIIEKAYNINIIKTDNLNRQISNILSDCETDVVILDKNTIVTPHWLSKLTYSAYTDDKIATVSPLTNQSDILNTQSNNILSSTQNNLNNTSKEFEIQFNDNYIRSVTSEDYCIYIKNEAYGKLDNYNYTNMHTLSYDLYNMGWINLRNNSVFLYNRQKKANPEINDEYHNGFYDSIEVKKINEIIKSKDTWDKTINRRRMLVFTQLDDDENVILDDKIKHISNVYDVYILALDGEKYYIYKYAKGILSLIDNNKVDYSFDTNFFEKTYFNLLINLKIDVLYTKHFKQLYHPTNRKFTSIIELVKYLEIDEIHECPYQDINLRQELDEMFYNDKSYEQIIEEAQNKLDFNNKRVVVYTAVTGEYDEPIIPSYVNKDFDYICFTDNPQLKSDFWTIKLMEEEDIDNIRRVRKYKILPHKYLSEYDYSIWIDTNFEITANLEDYIHKYSKENKLLAIKHEFRDCIYQEAETCINSNKDSSDVITKQIDEYKKEGYPEHNGLIASGILFRNHNDKQVIKVMQDWYNQLENYSYRDQLSFNYSCYKNNFTYDEAKIFYLKNPYFQRHDHIKNGFALRIADVKYAKDYDLEYMPEEIDDIMDAFSNQTTIIMPITNSHNLKQSIQSILDNTNTSYELMLINDNIKDIQVQKILSEFEKYDQITIINNQKSYGYVQNINQAINKSTDDIVIVDSNNIFTNKWLQKLKIKAYSNKDFATVTSLFNKSPYYQISDDDDFIKDNLETIANNIEKKSRNTILAIPTSDIRCMYIKRQAIYKTGFFDINFTKEYSAIDYSRRLLNRGWRNALDTSTFIYNQNEFNKDSTDKNNLFKQYPELKEQINEYIESIELNNIIRNIKYGIKSDNTKKKCILYALHGGIGGTLHTSIELIKNINNQLDAYLLITSTDKIELYKYSDNGQCNFTLQEEEFKKQLNLLRVWKLKSKYTLLDTSNKQIKWIYFNLLVYLNVDIVHIRHLIKSSLDLPYITGRIGIPTVLSFHDFYYVCPSHNLIDDNRQYCGGICPPLYEKSALGGQCNIIGELNIPLTRTIVHKWRDTVRDMFKNIDTFVTTSKSTYDIYTKFYPELKSSDFRIIEHGRDVKTPDTIERRLTLNPDEKIRIVFPGHLSHTKGYEIIKALKEIDTDDKLEFYYMGSLGGHEDLAEVGVDLGVYNRSDFNKIIHKINPHFIAILSIWPETYCHTLTEGWGSGVPILALDMGAVGERIKREGGGYLLDYNPQKAYKQIIEYAMDTNEYNKKKEEITKIKFKTTKQMGQEYMQIYAKYLNN